MTKRPRELPRNVHNGTRLIEEVISPEGAPVIGLYLFMAFGRLMLSMARGSRFAAIRPGAIGIPALLMAFPGASQTELADFLGIGRMTAGVQVAKCVRSGLVRRRRSVHDQRRYELHVTAKGRANLRRIASLIPQHEQHLFGQLSDRERAQLYRTLHKLVDKSAES